MSTARTVSFDLDDTLVRGPMAVVLRETVATMAADDPEIASVLYEDLMRRHNAILATRDPLAAYDWQSLTEEFARERRLPMPFDLTVRVRELAAAGGVTLVNGTTAAGLSQIRQSGWRVVVLTNGWLRFQQPVLQAVQLWDVFDDVVTSDRVGHAKPAPEAFVAARAHATCYVHVGDRMDHDIEGAAAVGATTVQLRTSPTPTDAPQGGLSPDFSATSLSQVAGFLETLA